MWKKQSGDIGWNPCSDCCRHIIPSDLRCQCGYRGSNSDALEARTHCCLIRQQWLFSNLENVFRIALRRLRRNATGKTVFVRMCLEAPHTYSHSHRHPANTLESPRCQAIEHVHTPRDIMRALVSNLLENVHRQCLWSLNSWSRNYSQCGLVISPTTLSASERPPALTRFNYHKPFSGTLYMATTPVLKKLEYFHQEG